MWFDLVVKSQNRRNQSIGIYGKSSAVNVYDSYWNPNWNSLLGKGLHVVKVAYVIMRDHKLPIKLWSFEGLWLEKRNSRPITQSKSIPYKITLFESYRPDKITVY